VQLQGLINGFFILESSLHKHSRHTGSSTVEKVAEGDEDIKRRKVYIKGRCV
jgi:hypothetical protein